MCLDNKYADPTYAQNVENYQADQPGTFNPNFQNPVNIGPAQYEHERQYFNVNTQEADGNNDQPAPGGEMYAQPGHGEEHSDSDPEEQVPMGAMKSKFEQMQMENAQMFDEEGSEGKNTIPAHFHGQQMEPIEEGYSSDDSFGAQQKHKNLRENFEYIQQENQKREAKVKKPVRETKSKSKRSHINVKTSLAENKENQRLHNKRSTPPRAASGGWRNPNAIIREKPQRPATGKMRTTGNFNRTGFRPSTAKTSKKGKKRPSTGYYKSGSTFGSSKPLRTKMMKKSDPVSRYQSMKNSWSKNKFLSK